MLNIKIICIGKVKETAARELINEYVKRISKYAKLEIIELSDKKIPDNASNAIEEQIKIAESDSIIEVLNKFQNAHVLLLDLNGKEYTSEEYANKIQNISNYSSSTIVFVIGGSLGMSKKLLEYSKDKICFSKMTFPHQLMRLFLLEQTFRAFKIINNEVYHK